MDPQGNPEDRIRDLERPLADEARASVRAAGSLRAAGPTAAAGAVGLWGPVFRAAAETPFEQPRVVDPGHDHRHWLSGHRGGHRRLRRTPAFQRPVDHQLPTDRLHDVWPADEHADNL